MLARMFSYKESSAYCMNYIFAEDTLIIIKVGEAPFNRFNGQKLVAPQLGKFDFKLQ